MKSLNENLMKANSDKFHLLLTIKEDKCVSIASEKVRNSKSEKLVGVSIDNKLNFNEHVIKLCDKASQKLNSVARVSSYTSIEKKSNHESIHKLTFLLLSTYLDVS